MEQRCVTVLDVNTNEGEDESEGEINQPEDQLTANSSQAARRYRYLQRSVSKNGDGYMGI